MSVSVSSDWCIWQSWQLNNSGTDTTWAAQGSGQALHRALSRACSGGTAVLYNHSVSSNEMTSPVKQSKDTYNTVHLGDSTPEKNICRRFVAVLSSTISRLERTSV